MFPLEKFKRSISVCICFHMSLLQDDQIDLNFQMRTGLAMQLLMIIKCVVQDTRVFAKSVEKCF